MAAACSLCIASSLYTEALLQQKVSGKADTYYYHDYVSAFSDTFCCSTASVYSELAMHKPHAAATIAQSLFIPIKCSRVLEPNGHWARCSICACLTTAAHVKTIMQCVWIPIPIHTPRRGGAKNGETSSPRRIEFALSRILQGIALLYKVCHKGAIHP